MFFSLINEANIANEKMRLFKFHRILNLCESYYIVFDLNVSIEHMS